MKKESKLTKESIIGNYAKMILEESKKPNSIYHFCQSLKIEETQFYQFFSSFEHLEESVFESFFENTLNLLSKSKEYNDYDAKTKLLSFYFTFFEQLTANRSLVIYLLSNEKNKLENLKKLSGLRNHFKKYIDGLGIETVNIPQEKIQKIQQKSISEMAWLQMLMTLKFWMDDKSPSFEKTDIFIEKSVHASFDMLDITPLKNIIDFGKFLWKEKMNN
ncbi:TetR family transcriptional regulator C-terminal domain-containing protein [Flavobacterium sp.]|uniref:TetR family transcriptional regulator C-terminal domain-containing protein n=1 Tax=Flavobacterium sp. TaxID=239 RepID=UPI003D2E22E4